MIIDNYRKNVYPVLDPLGEQKEVQNFSLSERLPDLSGKVIYCVSQVILGSEILIQRVADTIATAVKEVNVVNKRKPSAYMTEDHEFWDEIAANADAVVYGCGV